MTSRCKLAVSFREGTPLIHGLGFAGPPGLDSKHGVAPTEVAGVQMDGWFRNLQLGDLLSMKPYEKWDILHVNWLADCISSINSIQAGNNQESFSICLSCCELAEIGIVFSRFLVGCWKLMRFMLQPWEVLGDEKTSQLIPAAGCRPEGIQVGCPIQNWILENLSPGFSWSYP